MNDILKKINKDALYYYLSTGFIPRGKSLLGNNENNETLIYPKSVGNNSLNYLNSKKKLKSLFLKVISRNLPSNNEPIGFMLSGGIDSTSFLDLIRELTNRKIYTVTCIYDNTPKETISLIDEIVLKYKVFHKYIHIYENDIFLLDKLESYFDEPIAFDSGMIMDYKAFSYFKNKVSFVFNGYGDVIFSKEEQIYHNCLYREIKNNIKSINNELKGFISWDMFYKNINNNYIVNNLRFCNGYFNLNEIKNILGKNYQNINCVFSKNIEVLGKNKHGFIFDDTVFNTKTFYDTGLESLNKISNIFGIKVISPYLEKEIIDFSFNLPDEYRFNHFEMRFIFKDLFQNKIPKKVFYKNYSPGKMDFSKLFTNESVLKFIKKKLDFLKKNMTFFGKRNRFKYSFDEKESK